MKVKEIITLLEEFAPLAYAEDFDNTGLLVGDQEAKVTGILVTLDTLEAVVAEAIEKKCNLIVSFHPILFKGLKKLTGANYVQRVVQKAIKNDIHIFAIHTALDNSFEGVNAQICNTLELVHKKILIPQKQTIKKLITYAPSQAVEGIKKALFSVGGGTIGNYQECSFTSQGISTFKGNEHSNPVMGKKGVTQTFPEMTIAMTFAKHLEKRILSALLDSHPYEEVAYEITTLENTNQHIGMGMIAELQNPMDEDAFLMYLKEKMNTKCIRHSKKIHKPIKKVAVLGGSGSFAINDAIAQGADVYISSDLKYHDFYTAENKILLADIGHYESEQYTKELLHTYLTKKITNFAVVLSQINTNPISYF
jgi:dinuclear metal center YbgI/SA1388 family protein